MKRGENMTEYCTKESNPARPPQVITTVDGAAAILDARTFSSYYNRLEMLALNRYKWEGLPETCNALALEKWLYAYGKAAFVYDETLGYINLKCTASNLLNIYEIPTSFNCYSEGYEKDFDFDSDNFVLIRNNIQELPTQPDIELFTEKLSTIERTVDINIYGQRTPVAFLCDEKERLTFKNLWRKYDGFTPVFFGSKDLDLSQIKVLSTGAPFVADKLQNLSRNYWAQVMAYLGFNNVEHEKAERLTNDEINANNVLIENYSQIGLAWRQAAAAEANKKLWPGKYNVSVSLRTKEETEEIIERKAGADNG